MREIESEKTGFVIFGSTGCSCCRSENFIDGIYDDLETARERVISHTKSKTVASQYSSCGNYTICEVSYEILSDGRVILGDRVMDDVNFFLSGEEYYNMVYNFKTVE